ncbi:MAG: ABC transporter ATP-binding protein [bacterium]
MQTPAVFTLTDVGKRFGRRWVLQNISFEVFGGDFLLVLGGNGAGKSTLLKLLSSLMGASRGTLLFQGLPYAKNGTALRRALGVIFHDSHCYGDLTAAENLRVFGTLYGVEGLEAAIPHALEELRLEGYPEVPVRAYSSGMLKRLAFARLRLHRPRVLLLDEPFSGLDQDSIKLVNRHLGQFREEGGTTLMVTHQFTDGVGFANRILILNRGAVMYNEEVQNLTGERCAALLERFASAAPSPPTGA